VTSHVLTLNAGSSSIKFALYDGRLRSVGTGQVEGLGGLPRLFRDAASFW